MKRSLKVFNGASKELASHSRFVGERVVFIDKFAKMGDSTWNQDATNFQKEFFPGNCDGRLHVAHVDEVEGIILEGKGSGDDVVELYKFQKPSTETN